MKNRFLKILLVIISIYLFIGIIHTHIAVMRNLKLDQDFCKKYSRIQCPGASYMRWLFNYGLYWTIIGWPSIYEPIENGADMRGG